MIKIGMIPIMLLWEILFLAWQFLYPTGTRIFGPTGGTLGFDYYFKMAFGGLLNPDNPTQLIDEAKQYIPKGSSWSEIDRILKNEANGNNQANGTKCN